MGKMILNGALVNDANLVAGASNRGLRFGDGIFETFRVVKGIIQLEDLHFERFYRGLKALGFDYPQHLNAGLLRTQIGALCESNGHRIARVRLTVFRGDGGLYDPANHAANYIIQSWALDSENWTFNENGLVAGIYPDARKTMDSFSSLKTNNFLCYAMGALHAKKMQWNDSIIFNAAGDICETTIANIFIVKNGQVSTPALSEGCIAGVVRTWLLGQLHSRGIFAEEKQITKTELMSADEVFLTNSIYGLRWIKSIDAGEGKITNYNNQFGREIFDQVCKNPDDR